MPTQYWSLLFLHLFCTVLGMLDGEQSRACCDSTLPDSPKQQCEKWAGQLRVANLPRVPFEAKYKAPGD